MGRIKGVMLLPEDAGSYRRHVAHHTFMARVNAGESIPDFRSEFANLIEARAREEIGRTLFLTSLRVLRWEELSPANRWSVLYRELDGVYKAPDHSTVLLEVKASASKSSLASGLRQIRNAVNTLAIAQPSVFGLLVVADLGAFVEGFGQAVPMPLTEYFAEKNIEVIDWPPDLTSTKSEGIRVSVIPQSVTAGWLAEAGVLESAESDSECLALVE